MGVIYAERIYSLMGCCFQYNCNSTLCLYNALQFANAFVACIAEGCEVSTHKGSHPSPRVGMYQVNLLQALFLLKREQENPFSLDQCNLERIQGGTASDRLNRELLHIIPLTENTLHGDEESSAGHRAPPNKDSSTFQSVNLFGSYRIAWSSEGTGAEC